jgi:hypothetical protein
MKQGDMLAVLAHAEMAMGGYGGPVGRNLLDDAAGWNTLDVDYEPPRVERLWRTFQSDYRLYLHRIHPCEKALFHPHPWPSACKIMSGIYEMGIGYHQARAGEGQRKPDSKPAPPPVATTLILTRDAKYEMLDPNAWHWVRPLQGVSYSIMVTGPLWDRWSPKADHKLGLLSDETKAEMLATFKSFYGQ